MGSITSSCGRAMSNKNTSKTFPQELLNTDSPSKPNAAKSAFIPTTKHLTIIHFNDVYNIEPRDREPVGGAARFKTAIDQLRHKKPLVLFSGDALAPSNMSVFTEGEQMIPVLNSLGIHAAVYGNHDFDFGTERLLQVKEKTNFPWLMSNVVDKETDQLLANGEEFIIMEWNDTKIGLMGLVEEEWLVTLATLSVEDIIYTDYVKVAKRLESFFRRQGCELVIALTHMRTHNDKRLAENVPGLDIILGGHDHHYEIVHVNSLPVVKSGTDFRNFSEITVTIPGTSDEQLQSRCSFEFKEHLIRKETEENQEIKEVVEHYSNVVQDNLDEEIGHVKCSLEGRFHVIRLKETNLGNLICDIMRSATKADCALINAGTFRSDVVHEAGMFRMKDLVSILPMIDQLTVLSISGEQLLAALENGVCQYPKLEGRFPQVSGIAFAFDHKKPRGHRVLTHSVKINGEELDLQKQYRLCTKGYLAEGKDGYDVFRSLPPIVHKDEGPILCNIVRNYFTSSCKTNETISVDSAVADSDSSGNDEIDGGPASINPQIEGRIVCQ